MQRPPTDPPEPVYAPQHGFVTTRWSLVLEAGGSAAPQAQKALSELCELYWYPLYAFIRSKRYPAPFAEDLTQGFFTLLLEQNDLATVKPDRGRFRNWLLAAVEHYLSNQRKYEGAKKRGGDRRRIELEEAEISSSLMSGLTPEQVFEKRWAVRLLENALSVLGEECARTSNGQLFGKLRGRLTGETEELLVHIAKELGMEAGTVRVQYLRLRRRFKALIDQEILHTVKNRDEVSGERRFLISVLRGE